MSLVSDRNGRVTREGPFWDVMEGRAAPPPAAVLLGWEPALVATLDPGLFAPTTDLHVQFLRPARPGRLTGRGRIVRRGREVAFLTGELLDDSGLVVAAAVATAQIRALPVGNGPAGHGPAGNGPAGS